MTLKSGIISSCKMFFWQFFPNKFPVGDTNPVNHSKQMTDKAIIPGIIWKAGSLSICINVSTQNIYICDACISIIVEKNDKRQVPAIKNGEKPLLWHSLLYLKAAA